MSNKKNEKFKEHEKSIKKQFPTIEDLMFNNDKAKKSHARRQKYKKKD